MKDRQMNATKRFSRNIERAKKKALRPVGKTRIPALKNLDEEQKEIFIEAMKRNRSLKRLLSDI